MHTFSTQDSCARNVEMPAPPARRGTSVHSPAEDPGMGASSRPRITTGTGEGGPVIAWWPVGENWADNPIPRTHNKGTPPSPRPSLFPHQVRGWGRGAVGQDWISKNRLHCRMTTTIQKYSKHSFPENNISKLKSLKIQPFVVLHANYKFPFAAF